MQRIIPTIFITVLFLLCSCKMEPAPVPVVPVNGIQQAGNVSQTPVPPEDYAGVAFLKAEHRDGQTFLSWREIDKIIPDTAESWHDFKTAQRCLYRPDIIQGYRSSKPIGSLSQATLIAEVDSLSAWNSSFYGKDTLTKSIYLEKTARRFVINEGEEALGNGYGLYVFNPDNEGQAYYAVTAVVNGTENTAMTPYNNLAGPLSETVGQGSPVLQYTEAGATLLYVSNASLHFFVRWEAPPNSNIKGRPCNYLVAIPSNVKYPASVGLHLHSWGSNMMDGYTWWNNAEKGALLIASNQEPYDWWTGYHEKIGTEEEPHTKAEWEDGVVRPYTQNRMRAFYQWAQTRWEIDPSRTFIAGSSMGGSGSIMFALRYGGDFAWIRSYVGVHIPEKSPAFKSAYEQVHGPSGYEVGHENGLPVWDFYNDVWFLENNPAADIGFISFSNGKNDSSIGWEQAVAFINALQNARQPHLFVWGQGGHSQRTVMPLNHSEKTMPLDLRTNQSLPAFTGCSLDDVYGSGDPDNGDPDGQVNKYLYWDTETIIDNAERWEMTVALTSNAPEDSCTANLTPRRLQEFRLLPGQNIDWKNHDCSGTLLASGTAQVDQYGLVTINQLQIGKNKNRIVLVRK